jgi:hypothetical protein
MGVNITLDSYLLVNIIKTAKALDIPSIVVIYWDPVN